VPASLLSVNCSDIAPVMCRGQFWSFGVKFRRFPAAF
jgi:hypothetical protein